VLVKRPRLLFISPRFLFPMDEGGKIRTGNILKGLKTRGAFDMTLVSPAPSDASAHAADLATSCDRFISWPQPPRSRIKRALSLAGRLPVAVAADRSAAGRRAVARALAEQPDVVVTDFPHADVLAPSPLEPASVLFTHNVEAEIFERHASRARGPWKWVWADQGRKMRRFEQEALARYDSVIAVSQDDQQALISRYGLPQVAKIDTGVDLDFFRVAPPAPAADIDPEGGVLVFTATMRWAANVDGVHFLLDEVWPRLLAARPRIRAVIIGRDPPAALTEKIRERGLNVTLTGYVDDIRPQVADAHVYVIPVHVGSGTRIKAYEAMAMGRPVVSTTLGVAGLELTHGRDFLCADEGQAFADAILALLDDPGLRARIAASARRLVEEQFSWRTVAGQFEAICMDAIARRQAGGRAPRPQPIHPLSPALVPERLPSG
jgi:glycosyltransferase involved in cell wall biosynthesis